VEVVHDEEDGGEDDLHDGDEEEVGDDLGEIEFRAGSGRHALGVDDLVADFAGPCLIEGADGREHGGDGEHAAGDVTGEVPVGVEGDGEEDDDE